MIKMKTIFFLKKIDTARARIQEITIAQQTKNRMRVTTQPLQQITATSNVVNTNDTDDDDDTYYLSTVCTRMALPVAMHSLLPNTLMARIGPCCLHASTSLTHTKCKR